MGTKDDAPVVRGKIMHSYKGADQSLLALDGASAQPQQAFILCLGITVLSQSASCSIARAGGVSVYLKVCRRECGCNKHRIEEHAVAAQKCPPEASYELILSDGIPVGLVAS